MSQKFSISGTKCHSCEVNIERTLQTVPGIKKVSVSHAKKSLEITGSRNLSLDELNEIIGPQGYEASSNTKSSPPEKTPINWKRVGGIFIVVFALYFLFKRLGFLAWSPSAGSTPTGLVAVFVVGLVASVSSCTAVVGGLILAPSSHLAKTAKNASTKTRLRPHLFFNIGRIVGFAGFGALVGLVGKSVQISSTVNGFFIVALAIIMILLGLHLLDLFPTSIIKPPKFLTHRIHDLSTSSNPFAPALLGAMTFFLPCGFTQSMQIYALSLQDPLSAAMVMTVFALGTAPALFGIGALTSTAKGPFLKRVTSIAGILVIVLGMSNIVNGATLMGFSPSFPSSTKTIQEAPIVAPVVDGKQTIQMEITSELEYSPNVLTVKKGIPVEWQIFGGKFLGCADTLVSSALKINTHLKPGMNIVKFTPTKAGKFTFSCSMGMFRGTMIVIE